MGKVSIFSRFLTVCESKFPDFWHQSELGKLIRFLKVKKRKGFFSILFPFDTNLLFVVFDRFTHFEMFWTRSENFWKMSYQSFVVSVTRDLMNKMLWSLYLLTILLPNLVEKSLKKLHCSRIIWNIQISTSISQNNDPSELSSKVPAVRKTYFSLSDINDFIIILLSISTYSKFS